MFLGIRWNAQLPAIVQVWAIFCLSITCIGLVVWCRALQAESKTQNDLIVMLIEHDRQLREWLLKLDPPADESATEKAARQKYLRRQQWIDGNVFHVVVKCDECGGDGIVEYPADHPLVKARQYQAGEKCGCPMCGGEGELILEKGHSDE